MNPIAFTSTIDITAWTADASKKIGDCILEHPVKFIAFYPEDLIEKWHKLRFQYGVSVEGQGRVLYRMGLSLLAPKIMKS